LQVVLAIASNSSLLQVVQVIYSDIWLFRLFSFVVSIVVVWVYYTDSWSFRAINGDRDRDRYDFVAVTNRDSKNRKMTTEIEIDIVINSVYVVSFKIWRKKIFFFFSVVVIVVVVVVVVGVSEERNINIYYIL
jgi:hypothetical protein